MSMTSAERQRAYRERHLGADGGKVRMELTRDMRAAAALLRWMLDQGVPVTSVEIDVVNNAF